MDVATLDGSNELDSGKRLDDGTGADGDEFDNGI